MSLVLLTRAVLVLDGNDAIIVACAGFAVEKFIISAALAAILEVRTFSAQRLGAPSARV